MIVFTRQIDIEDIEDPEGLCYDLDTAKVLDLYETVVIPNCTFPGDFNEGDAFAIAENHELSVNVPPGHRSTIRLPGMVEFVYRYGYTEQCVGDEAASEALDGMRGDDPPADDVSDETIESLPQS